MKNISDSAFNVLIITFSVILFLLIVISIAYLIRNLIREYSQSIKYILLEKRHTTSQSLECRRMRELNRQVEQYDKIVRALMLQFDWPMPIAKSVLMSGKHTDKANRNFTLCQYKDENGEMCWALKPVEMRVNQRPEISPHPAAGNCGGVLF